MLAPAQWHRNSCHPFLRPIGAHKRLHPVRKRAVRKIGPTRRLWTASTKFLIDCTHMMLLLYLGSHTRFLPICASGGTRDAIAAPPLAIRSMHARVPAFADPQHCRSFRASACALFLHHAACTQWAATMRSGGRGGGRQQRARALGLLRAAWRAHVSASGKGNAQQQVGQGPRAPPAAWPGQLRRRARAPRRQEGGQASGRL